MLINKKTIFLIIFLFSMFFTHLVLADCSGQTSKDGTVELCNPLGDKTDTSIPTLLGKIINSVLGIIGSLALVMFIYGGATWMLSGGNQEKVTKGKQILIWATFGLVIIFTAYALVRFVLTTITA